MPTANKTDREDGLDKLDEHIAHQHKMRRILGIAVISVAAIIVVLWGFALRNRIAGFSWNGSTEQRLLESAQADWEAVQAVTADREAAVETAKNQVKDKLTAIFAAAASSTGISSYATETASGTEQ